MRSCFFGDAVFWDLRLRIDVSQQSPSMGGLPSEDQLMQILLVTEEELLAELIAFRLELLGHSVEIKADSEQMLRSLQDSTYSLLILDTQLPDTNTRDSLSKVRSRWSKDILPILMISMDQSLELVELAFRCGADDYLLAPFDPQAMQNKLEELLNGRRLVSKLN